MFLGDPTLLQSIRVTITYVVVSVPAILVLSLALAMLLNRGLQGLTVYRALFYLPSLLGGSVAIAVLWKQVFGTDGMLNEVLLVFHIHGPTWIGIPSTALYTLVMLNVWQFGATMIIFLAGLRQIPQTLYESAQVDGAGTVRRFLHITIPMLSPVIFFNGVLGLIRAFQVFTSAYVISNGTGQPAGSMVLIAGLTGLAFLTARFWVFYGDQG
jgi:multiple sugar transport system permease protein